MNQPNVKTYSLGQLTVAVKSSSKHLKEVLDAKGIKPLAVYPGAAGRNYAFYGQDAMDAAQQWRKEIVDRTRASKALKTLKATRKQLAVVQASVPKAPKAPANNPNGGSVGLKLVFERLGKVEAALEKLTAAVQAQSAQSPFSRLIGSQPPSVAPAPWSGPYPAFNPNVTPYTLTGQNNAYDPLQAAVAAEFTNGALSVHDDVRA